MNTKNIIWQGIYYNSLENCIIRFDEKSIEINSIIVGHLNDLIYSVEYFIKTNKSWETQLFDIKAKINNSPFCIVGQKTDENNWKINGEIRSDLYSCTDIDISLTPFTNSLPINRLNLANGNEKYINVLYINVLEQKMTAVEQKYSRINAAEYKYGNVPNNFEAIVTVDKAGIVINYPKLFKRTAINE